MIPTKTAFTVTPVDGAMDTQATVDPGPGDIVAPAYIENMVVGTWYQIGGDTPDVPGMAAAASGTRIADDVDPANSIETNPDYPSNPPYHGATGFRSLFDAWNSGAFVPTLGTSGSLVYWGGGHTSYYGNEVVRFDIDSREFSRMSDPSTAGPFVQGDGVPLDNGAFYDGTPCPPHTYAHLQYCPAIDSLVCIKAQTYSDSPDNGSSDVPQPWRFSFDALTWSSGPIAPTIQSDKCGMVWDTETDTFLNFNTMGDCGRYTPTGDNGDGTYGSWEEFLAPGTISTYTTPTIDYGARMIVAQHFRSACVIKKRPLDSLTTGWTNVTIINPPTTFAVGQGSTWDWCETLGGIVCAISGTTDVYLITSSDNWATCQFALLTVDGNSQDLSANNGIFQKIRCIDYGDHVLLAGLTASDAGIFAMRLV